MSPYVDLEPDFRHFADGMRNRRPARPSGTRGHGPARVHGPPTISPLTGMGGGPDVFHVRVRRAQPENHG